MVYDNDTTLRYAGIAQVLDDSDIPAGAAASLNLHWWYDGTPATDFTEPPSVPSGSKMYIRFDNPALYSQIDRVRVTGHSIIHRTGVKVDMAKRDENGSEWEIPVYDKNWSVRGQGGAVKLGFIDIYLKNGQRLSDIPGADKGFQVTHYWTTGKGLVSQESLGSALLRSPAGVDFSTPSIGQETDNMGPHVNSFLGGSLQTFTYDQEKNVLYSTKTAKHNLDFFTAFPGYIIFFKEHIDPELAKHVKHAYIYASTRFGDPGDVHGNPAEGVKQYELQVDKNTGAVTSEHSDEIGWNSSSDDKVAIRYAIRNILPSGGGGHIMYTVRYELDEEAAHELSKKLIADGREGRTYSVTSWVESRSESDINNPNKVIPTSYAVSYLNPQDVDYDGLLDAYERTLSTVPTNPDTDGDGVPDGVEQIEDHTDPKNAGSYLPGHIRLAKDELKKETVTATSDSGNVTEITVTTDGGTQSTELNGVVPRPKYKKPAPKGEDSEFLIHTEDGVAPLKIVAVPESAIGETNGRPSVDLAQAKLSTELGTRPDYEKGEFTLPVTPSTELGEYVLVAVSPNGEITKGPKLTITDKAIPTTDAPTIAQPKVGDKHVTVTATSGATVKVILQDGTELPATEKADAPGTFVADVPVDHPLKLNQTVRATAQDAGKRTSPEASAEIQPADPIVVDSISNRAWKVGKAIAEIAVPGAEDFDVQVDGLPEGVSYDPASHKISGTPDKGQETVEPKDVTLTYTKGDQTVVKRFAYNVAPEDGLSVTPISPQSWAVDVPVDIEVPDTGTMDTVTVTGLPDGVEYHADTHHISGTPKKEAALSEATVTYTKGEKTAKSTFAFVVKKGAPLVTSTLKDRAWIQNKEIDPIVVPETDGMDSVKVTGLPDGVSYDEATHTIKGAPTAAVDDFTDVTITYTKGNKTENVSFSYIVRADADGDSIPDDVDSDLKDGPTGDKDGDGKANNVDPDADGDGINNADEKAAGLDPLSADTNRDGTPDGEEDTDGDGTKNSDESEVPTGTVADADKDGLGDTTITDKNGNHVADLAENPTTGTQDGDKDGDGIPDSKDPDNQDGPLGDKDGDKVPNNEDPDADGDGINNADEKAAGLDPLSADTNRDGTPDGDEDSDKDGIKNSDESEVPAGTVADADKDGIGDTAVTDKAPADGIADIIDGPAMLDTDGDGVPDATDPDIDNDGVNNADEIAAGLDPRKADTDGDGTPDGKEDTDGDGITNEQESDAAGSGVTDKDGDGVPDIIGKASGPAVGELGHQAWELNKKIKPIVLTDVTGGVTATVKGLPDGVTYNTDTHTIEGTPTKAVKTPQTVTVSYAKDGRTTTRTFTFVVNDPAKPEIIQSSVPGDLDAQCLAAIGSAVAIPLVVLLPLGLAMQMRVPGMEPLTNMVEKAIADFNKELQVQAGLFNPALAKPISDLNDNLHRAKMNLGTVIAGASIAAAGLVVIGLVVNACVNQDKSGSSEKDGSSSQ